MSLKHLSEDSVSLKYLSESFLGEQSVSLNYLGEESVFLKYLGEEHVYLQYLVEESVSLNYLSAESVSLRYLGEESVSRWKVSSASGLSGPPIPFLWMVSTMSLLVWDSWGWSYSKHKADSVLQQTSLNYVRYVQTSPILLLLARANFYMRRQGFKIDNVPYHGIFE